MKRSISVLAATMWLTCAVAVATTHDNTNAYVATIDPPTGSMKCGFNVSGTVKSPKAGFLSYGFFWRSELNIVSPLFNQRHPTKQTTFTGPDSIKVTGTSKDVGDDQVFQKHKTIQVQLRVWWTTDLGAPYDQPPRNPPLTQSVWVDVPVTSPGCATMTPALGLSKAAPATNSAPAHSAAPQAPK